MTVKPLLETNTIGCDLSPTIPLIDRHSPRTFPILNVSSNLKKIVFLPPLVVHHHPSNLKDLLVRARFGPPHLSCKGNSQCDQPCCKMCHHIRTIDSFSSMTTGRTFKIKVTVDYQTRNVVCVIECLNCKIQYAGEIENVFHIYRRSGNFRVGKFSRFKYSRVLFSPSGKVAKFFYGV